MSVPDSPSEPAESPMRISSPLSSGVSARPLVDFFARAIASFQRSSSTFEVVCTLPPACARNGPAFQSPSPIPPKTRPRAIVVLDSSFNPPTWAHLRMATSAIHDLRAWEAPYKQGVRLLLLLAINNADKAPKPAAFEERLAMMWAFATDVQHSFLEEERSEQPPSAQVEETMTGQLTVDIALSTQPYFHEKSAAIANADFYKAEGGEDETEQIILTGYDTLIRIFNPKYYGPPSAEGQVEDGEETPMQRALGPFLQRAKLRVTMRTDDEWGTAAEQRAYLGDLAHADGLSRIGGSKEWGSRVDLVEGRKAGEDIVSSTYARGAAKSQNWERLARMVSPQVRSLIAEQHLYTE